MRRKPDWRECLAAFLESRKAAAKAWGFNDCALFCADAIEAMTGIDVAIEFRGEYRHDAGAARALRRFLERRGDICAALAEQFLLKPGKLLEFVAEEVAGLQGFPEIEPKLAEPGDAVLLDVREWTGDGERWTVAMGILGLDGLPRTAATIGTVTLPARAIVRAWRI